MLISKKNSAKFRPNFTKFGNFGGGRNFGDTEIKNLIEHLQEFLKHSPNLEFLAKLRKTGVQQFLKSTPNLLALLKSESFARKDTRSCARADPAATR